MMRLFAISMSALMLLQSFHVTVSDLVQLDELLEHAQYHRQQFGDNFFVFLSKHYGAEKEEHSREHQEEQPQHEQLPFQQLAHLSGAHTFILRKPAFEFGWLPESPAQKPNFHYIPLRSTPFQSGVFQPPRQA
ncbi:hypothetical protein [Robiginitalea biformata]|uniref:Uncharacterized protein n=1 Tax=Robiginitalea biformata (strain ATCC BAA-864 / DSM 15991 / KCTC 12146 / HTCC2501) TaxID=313596 RepID=A4CHA1_ROBBH|nr:hypothetical protein [Robiginitalea biformata]EAR16309.1 hypothetical protein RB2501_05405 [Robiginitalea biformata HTCC2501]